MMIRRSFLQYFLGAGLWGGVVSGWSRLFSSGMDVVGQPALLRIINDPQAINAIGKAYLALHPDHRSKTALRDQINALLSESSSLNLKDRLDQRIKEDFAINNTVQLKGWVLSVTEAQQCALYALERS